MHFSPIISNVITATLVNGDNDRHNGRSPRLVGTTDHTMAKAPTVVAPALFYCIVRIPDLSTLPFLSINEPFLPALRDAYNIQKLAKGRWGDTAYLLGGWSGERKDGALENWTPIHSQPLSKTVQWLTVQGVVRVACVYL